MILYQVTQDLRLNDNLTLNAALSQAAERQEPLVGVWFPTPSFMRASSIRKGFILYELEIYKKNLFSIGIYLHIIAIPILEFVESLKDKKITRIYKTQSWGIEEQLIDKQVASSFDLVTINQGQLFEECDLPFAVHQTPEIFTQFRKLVENRVKISSPQELAKVKVESQFMTEWEDNLISSKQSQVFCYWQGGEAQARQHLQNYIWDKQIILSYKETRNGLINFEDSTKLSPFLALGILSPRQVYFEVKKFEKVVKANESTYWVYFELLWREYFRWIAKKWGFKFYTGMNQVHPANENDATRAVDLFKKWCAGETSEDFVNANMRELNATGWMSNRGRQNVASYLIHQLNVPWAWGANYFEQQLLDYDPFSNWGNWSYLAGVGQDPRQRIFNIQKQAQQYDPQGLYQKLWSCG